MTGLPVAVPALGAHVRLVAARMRKADRDEVRASHGLRPGAALRASMAGSDFARTLFIDGQPLGMFGVKVQDGCGVAWALTTDVVDQHPLAFWRASRHVAREIAARYPTLVQCIDARHEQALRWARHLGFSVDREPHACGPQGLPFHLVHLRREEVPHAG